ncbi:RidA family protein [Tabrizicola sp.]|uniref:RidA family protein n=1 Tax=Tabrizicola sp. TaxID=2005166 RepID=UPI002FDDB76D
MIIRHNPANLHQPIGTYVQAVRAGDWVVTSGQSALDIEGKIRFPGEIAGQTRATLENLTAALAGAGAGLRDVVRMTVYLADYAEYGAMDRVFSEFFKDHPPARATLLAPIIYPELRVEIEAWAWAPQAAI